jgi:hypothetical protein
MMEWLRDFKKGIKWLWYCWREERREKRERRADR